MRRTISKTNIFSQIPNKVDRLIVILHFLSFHPAHAVRETPRDLADETVYKVLTFRLLHAQPHFINIMASLTSDAASVAVLP